MTTVVFRRWRTGSREVIALFPELPASVIYPDHCVSYVHFGQHGPASPDLVMQNTEPVSRAAKDCEELYQELLGQGYDDLKIVKKLPRGHLARRRAQLAETMEEYTAHFKRMLNVN